MEERKKYVRLILNIAIPLTGFLLAIFLGPPLLAFFMPFVIGWVLAMIANPPVRYLERHLKMVRRHSSMMIIVLVLAAVVGLSYLIVLAVYREAAALAADAPQLLENMVEDVTGALQNSKRLIAFLPAGLRQPILEFSDNVSGLLGTLISKAAAPTVEIAGNVARSIPNILVNTVVTILAAYFFLSDRDRIIEQMKHHLPAFVFHYVDHLKQDVKGVIGGYFLAQFRIMFVVAAILTVGFMLLGIKYNIILAVLISMVDFLPIFGTGTILFPWAVVKIFTGEYGYALTLILIYVVTQVVRQIIQPKIVGDSMGLNPLMTLFFLYLGFKIRGIAGMILAVPIGIIFINFYKYGAFDNLIQNVKLLADEVNRFRRGE